MDKKILTRQETADYLSIGLCTLDKLITRRENPLPHVRAGKRVLIPLERLEAWIDAEADRECGGSSLGA